MRSDIEAFCHFFSEVTKISTLARKGNWNFVGKKNQYESAFSPHSILKSNFGVWITVKKLLYLSHKGASITRQPTNECRAALQYQILWRWTFLIVVLGTKWRTKKGIIFEKEALNVGQKSEETFHNDRWRFFMKTHLGSLSTIRILSEGGWLDFRKRMVLIWKPTVS